MQQFMSRKELSKILNVHPQTLLRLEKQKKIESIKIGGSVRYNFDAVIKSLTQNKR